MDGFNLYYGALKNTQYKWLDILVLCQRLLNRNNQIEGIHYFTALVNGSPDDPSKGRRQQLYLKALSLHIPFFDVEWGQFTRHLVQVPLAPSDLSKLPEGTKIPVGHRQSVFNTQWVPRDRYFGVKVDIVKTEEKGSDVNLALKLLQHAWEDRYDCAVIISNDSDLAGAIDLVKQRGKVVGLMTPKGRPTKLLSEKAHFQKRITERYLKRSQLPDLIPNSRISKPDVWNYRSRRESELN